MPELSAQQWPPAEPASSAESLCWAMASGEGRQGTAPGFLAHAPSLFSGTALRPSSQVVPPLEAETAPRVAPPGCGIFLLGAGLAVAAAPVRATLGGAL